MSSILRRHSSGSVKLEADSGGRSHQYYQEQGRNPHSQQSASRPSSGEVPRQNSTASYHGVINHPQDSSLTQSHPPMVKREPESGLERLSLDDQQRRSHSQTPDSMRHPVKRAHHDLEHYYPNKLCRSSTSPMASPHHRHPSGSIRTQSPPTGRTHSYDTAHSSPRMLYSQPHRSSLRQSTQSPRQINFAALKEAERRSLLNAPPAAIVYDPPPDNDIKLLLQPETRPISQEQLVNEVKGIYSGLTMVERKCVEIDLQQSQSRTKLSNEQWQALIALHRTLLHEHHDFFLASQHPTASAALRRLPEKYAMPARMWRHGIHSFLELLRHRLPQSQEHMLNFIYLAYQTMGLLKESVPAFYETWIECLGDIARYRMAIEESDMRDRETWANVARMWYALAADRSPNIGRIMHHMAVLSRPNVVRQLFYYSKSLTSVVPFVNARDSIMLLFTQFLEDDVTQKYSRIEFTLNTGAAILFTRGSIHRYVSTILEFLPELDIHIARSASNFKTVGAEISAALGSLMLDFGHEDNFLVQAFRRNQENIKQHLESRLSTVSLEKGPTADAVIQEQIRQQYWQELEPTAPERFVDLHPLAGEQSDAKFKTSDQVTAYVLPIWSASLSIVAQRVGDRNILPYIHIALAMIWSYSFVPDALIGVEEYVCWADLALCLNAMSKSGISSARIEAKEFPQLQSGIGRQLPEDFQIRGYVWSSYYFPQDHFSGDTVDEDERTLERPSHASYRAERCLWLGHKIAIMDRYLTYNPQDQVFAPTEYALILASRNAEKLSTLKKISVLAASKGR